MVWYTVLPFIAWRHRFIWFRFCARHGTFFFKKKKHPFNYFFFNDEINAAFQFSLPSFLVRSIYNVNTLNRDSPIILHKWDAYYYFAISIFDTSVTFFFTSQFLTPPLHASRLWFVMEMCEKKKMERFCAYWFSNLPCGENWQKIDSWDTCYLCDRCLKNREFKI